ncbi:hypothetical protein PTSG_06125 [Salpingoeca rosetta]|uniref:Uncharacterized protein n=1 Tax=Salpingoeca rosetta (strain ATCC 50818 / BSB-021) TaxID=946362 RepID=F2UC08_SALR5|nr:uncharacterized protein PTSG_06125 [Salpingoeca rosetta]EGD74115.1 hypothetical protein PTSG_06125 [Salpingoeca rosetta]|eukprot:XP_004993016.1 hypothetical protein PTSG_06125 [Salpingoeca rosetta]
MSRKKQKKAKQQAAVAADASVDGTLVDQTHSRAEASSKGDYTHDGTAHGDGGSSEQHPEEVVQHQQPQKQEQEQEQTAGEDDANTNKHIVTAGEDDDEENDSEGQVSDGEHEQSGEGREGGHPGKHVPTRKTTGLRSMLASMSRAFSGSSSAPQAATQSSKASSSAPRTQTMRKNHKSKGQQQDLDVDAGAVLPLLVHFEDQWRQLSANNQVNTSKIQDMAADVAHAHAFVSAQSRQHRVLAQQFKVLPEVAALAVAAQGKIDDLHTELVALDERLRAFQAVRQACVLENTKVAALKAKRKKTLKATP